ncbi:MAG: ABC transporter permease [Verrucomicrobia bacterium]|nr:ABC transporter permease [Verrucomicrobiota bacterium]
MFRQHPTLRYITARAGWYALTFLVAVTINFWLPRLGEANPVDTLMARVSGSMDAQAAREREESYLREFGLVQTDDTGKILRAADGTPLRTSILTQFLRYLRMSLQGDFGRSIVQHPRPVSDIILTALPWTLALQIPALVLGWFIGNGLGALAAYRRGVLDKVFYPVALLVSAIPSFCFGILLVYIFGVQLEWLPTLGGYDEALNPGFNAAFLSSAATYYILPFLSVFLLVVGGQAIGMRSMCIYELGTDYVRYAKLMGVRESTIVRYMFRNAMLPQLTGLALTLGGMVGGALIAEMVFSYPGLGLSVLTAIQSLDYPVITGCTLLVTTCVLVANFTVDILIGFLDPRIRAAREGEA